MSRPQFDPATDYYGLLGLTPRANPEEIRTAYRRLAKRYHPDLHAGSSLAAARMARLNVAKTVLLDQDTRAAYDAARRARFGRSAGPGPATVAAVSYAPSAHAWVRPTSPVRPSPAARPRRVVAPARKSGFDRATAVLLVILAPLVCALVFYVAEAVRVASQPVRQPAADLALAPVTRPDPRVTANTIYTVVAGKPPNRQLGRAAYQMTQYLWDTSPEAEVIRAAGRRLYRAGADGDTESWNTAVQMLCSIAERC